MAVEEILGVLPNGWHYTTLGKACESGGGGIQTGPFGSQLHASDYVPIGIPSIMPQNIGDNHIIEEGIARITEDDATRLARYLVKDGDIIYSRRGDVERRALIRSHQEGWLCGTGCLRVRLGLNGPNPVYASFYLSHPNVREWIVRHAHGATMLNLNTSILSACPFVVPDDSDQEAIAATLGALDDKIELNRRMNKTLEAMIQATFKSWFVDFDPVRAKAEGRDTGLAHDLAALFPDQFGKGDLPQGWELVPVLAHAELISGGTPKTSEPRYWNGAIPWASAKDVSQCNDVFLVDTERTITEEGLSRSSSRMIHALSTVVVARGATTGRHCLFGREIAMNQTCYALSSRNDRPYWFYCAFGNLAPDLVYGAHGSVFDTITTTTLERARITTPTCELIDAFEALVEPLFSSLLNNIESSKTLLSLRDLLLPKLMSGDIRIKDAKKLVGEAGA